MSLLSDIRREIRESDDDYLGTHIILTGPTDLIDTAAAPGREYDPIIAAGLQVLDDAGFPVRRARIGMEQFIVKQEPTPDFERKRVLICGYTMVPKEAFTGGWFNFHGDEISIFGSTT